MKRLLTGDRTTGPLHLGHYVGTLESRISMQDRYETFIMQADAQALTDNFENSGKVHDAVREVALDNLAAGLDPKKVTFFIQSQVPELSELTMYFMNLVTLSRVKRNPTVKDEMDQKGFGLNIPLGFAVYPVSQAADILAFNADVVPVGEDQAPMIEQTREIAKRFNALYGETFAMPEAEIGRVGRLVGTDGGAKMSKSLGNVVYLSDPTSEVHRKVMSMYTDPARIRPDIPGKVEGNPVFVYLQTFGTEADHETILELETRYKEGKVGDVEVKTFLYEVLNDSLPLSASAGRNTRASRMSC
jgi:tryptophanyl-tRNA synthetase